MATEVTVPTLGESVTEASGAAALAGGLLQFGIQLPWVLRLERQLKIRWDLKLEGVREAARNAGARDNEEKLAREMRSLAYTEIDRDVEQVQAELEKIAADVEKIRSGFASFSSAVSGTLTPLLGLLGKTVKKH